MRVCRIAVPLALLAAPALAQSRAPADVPGQLPPELSDPTLVGRLNDGLQVLAKSFLSLPVGELEAALEGRQPTAADKRRTVQSDTGMSERELKAKIAESRPAMEAGMRALQAALPAMMKGMAEAEKELERATANMPQPGYPKR